MANNKNSKGGLPDGFNLSVTSDDLVGKPVHVGSYLDEDPVLDLLKARRQAALAEQGPSLSVPQVAPKVPAPTTQVSQVSSAEPPVVQPKDRAEQSAAEAVDAVQIVAQDHEHPQPPPKQQKAKPPVRRLQINLTPESERQIHELLEMIAAQSAEQNVTFSDIFTALILNLSESRTSLNVSRLPLRGRWGSPTARSFPVALAQAFREAIMSYGMKVGGIEHKQVVGG